jgi:PAS domain S-box-containing protein
MVEKLNILLLEDIAEDVELIITELNKADFLFRLKVVDTKSDFLNVLKTFSPDLILADYTLPSYDGLSALLFARKNYSDIPFIFVSGTIGEEKAIETMRSGATDYVLKEKLSKLCTVIKRAIREKDERQKRLIAEKLLHESEEKFRVLYNNSPDMYVSVSPDNACIILCNETLLKNTGYSIKEIIGSPIYKMYHNDCMAEVKKTFQQFIETGVIKEKELILKRKNGSKIDVSLNVNSVKNEAGKVLYSVFSWRDITTRKQAEASLQESQATFLTVLDGIDASIYAADMETYEILFMNKHMIDSFGEDFTGKICWEVFRHEPGPCGHCTNDKLLDEKGHPTGVQIWHDKNPVTGKWLINYDRAIKWVDGRYVRLQIASDITKFKRMEEQFQQAQKMESVGRLAGGVAHDFNNALSVIIGTAELVLNDVEPTGQLRENMDEIIMAGKHAADITRQLLAFARKQTISPKVLDLNETVGSMLKMLRHLIGEDIDLAWLPGANLWSVNMDPSQINQILANLCVNARDAIEDVGKITIETAAMTFDPAYCDDHTGFVPGEFVLLTVSDNGCGMNKKILNNIFEPFFTTKDVDQGTGLGLATVYGIVKQNKGFINVYSEPDKGTAIKIYMQKHMGKAVEIHEENIEEIPLGKGETILVVEDDTAILKLVKKILQGQGYTVLTSSEPEKTMGIVREYTGKIHLLITDVVMPKMNGRDLAELLQSICPDLKCIFMSGYTATAISHQGVLDKGVNFIQKPLSRRKLAEIVRKVLDG